MSNLAEWLIANRKTPEGTYGCPMVGCRYRGPSSTFADVTKRASQFEGHGFVCSHHFHAKNEELAKLAFDADLLIISKMTKKQQAEVSSLVDWWGDDKEDANYIRAERRMIFEKWGWTLLPGQADHLSPACRESFKAYFDTLNRITVDFPRPSAVTWPQLPALEYGTDR